MRPEEGDLVVGAGVVVIVGAAVVVFAATVVVLEAVDVMFGVVVFASVVLGATVVLVTVVGEDVVLSVGTAAVVVVWFASPAASLLSASAAILPDIGAATVGAAVLLAETLVLGIKVAVALLVAKVVVTVSLPVVDGLGVDVVGAFVALLVGPIVDELERTDVVLVAVLLGATVGAAVVVAQLMRLIPVPMSLVHEIVIFAEVTLPPTDVVVDVRLASVNVVPYLLKAI